MRDGFTPSTNICRKKNSEDCIFAHPEVQYTNHSAELQRSSGCGLITVNGAMSFPVFHQAASIAPKSGTSFPKRKLVRWRVESARCLFFVLINWQQMALKASNCMFILFIALSTIMTVVTQEYARCCPLLLDSAAQSPSQDPKHYAGHECTSANKFPQCPPLSESSQTSPALTGTRAP